MFSLFETLCGASVRLLNIAVIVEVIYGFISAGQSGLLVIATSFFRNIGLSDNLLKFPIL